MDRNTRRANFRKLQEAANNNNEPEHRITSNLSLSAYFDNAEAKKDPANPSSSVKKSSDSHIFEPPGPRPKKAPKLNSKTVSSRRGKSRPQGNRKQSTISDFLRNEQIFSEVTAQHCLADNFSPEDIEMALALSKSEANKQGNSRLVDDEEVVNLLGEEKPEGSSETLRRKLQKYGFRTAAKEDYNPLAYAAALPALRRGKRAKWANKFTPLTLRNPEVQQKKLEGKLAALLMECDVRTKPMDLMMPPYQFISSKLQKLNVPSEQYIINEPSEDPIELNSYYVKDLIEISYTPAEHLLKDWSAIQGRDLSPKRLNTKTLKRLEQFEIVYKGLEKHFDNGRAIEMELNDLEQLVVENMVEDVTQVNETEPISSTSSSPLKEPPDKRVRLSPEKENILPQLELQSSCTSNLSLPKSNIRCTSPDLFADSDEELYSESSEVRNLSVKVYKNVSSIQQEESSQITCYEIYTSSSDEVKTVSDATPQPISNGDVIDLTQGDTKSEKSSSEPAIYLNESPTIESDSDVDNLNCTSVMLKSSQEPCSSIAKGLNIKSTAESKKDSSISVEIQTCSLSFSHWNNSAKSLQDFDTCHPKSGENNTQSSMQFDLETSPRKVSENSFELDMESSPLSFSHWNKSDKLIPDASSNSFNVSEAKSQSFSKASPLSFSHWNNSNYSPSDSLTKCKLALQSFDSNVSIDLTQQSDNDDGILLSDDEINYSIWKANKTRDLPHNSSDGSDGEAFSILPQSIKKSTIDHFKTAEDLDEYLKNSRHSSNISKERAEFGILEDKGLSQPFNLSQTSVQNSQMDIDWSEGSFLEPTSKPTFNRKSSHKFQEFLREQVKPIEDEFDEFDQMVFQSAKDSTKDESMPSGLDQLLKGEINIETIPQSPQKIDTKTNKQEELELNGKVYHISICNTPKPDFTKLSESVILQQLYNYGIKPLKRKQAIKMLEFIYNQTHPIMQEEFLDNQNIQLPRSKSTPVPIMPEGPHCSISRPHNETAKIVPTDTKFQDAFDSELLRFSQTQGPSLCDDFEFYILQTNVSKKTPQPLVPFHIAWHNLLCANPKLHESLLMYEPIDLQEIYLHFKQMGHRYDPKDLKLFFDRRCIIFRYELPGTKSQGDRHIRKQPTERQNKRVKI